MDAHEIEDLLDARRAATRPYFEFLRVPAMSVGVYELPEAGEDPQTPHGEDEVYYVLEGRATIRVGAQDRDVSTGSVIFVPARVEHRFHAIREMLRLLVIFAPAEGTHLGASPARRRRKAKVRPRNPRTHRDAHR